MRVVHVCSCHLVIQRFGLSSMAINDESYDVLSFPFAMHLSGVGSKGYYSKGAFGQ